MVTRLGSKYDAVLPPRMAPRMFAERPDTSGDRKEATLIAPLPQGEASKEVQPSVRSKATNSASLKVDDAGGRDHD
jgi:hypothetical protein